MKKICIATALAVAVLAFMDALAPAERTTVVRAFAGGQTGAASSAREQVPAGSPPAVTEELIVEKDPGAAIDEEEEPLDTVSTDGRRVAWRTPRGKKWAVMLSGAQQAGEFDEVHTLTFSGDSRHLAFAARRDKAWIIVLDGKEAAQTFQKILGPLFSPDGTRLAHLGKREGKWGVILNGEQVGATFDELYTVAFSPDSQRLAYVGRRDKWIVAVDEKEGPPFDVVGGIQFSPDGRRFSYAGAEIKSGFGGDKGLGRVIIDGEPGLQFQSEKSSSFAGALAGGATKLVPGYFSDLSVVLHGVSSPVFNPDGSRVAYAAHRGKDNEVVMLDGQPGPQFAAIVSGPLFSPDGKRLAYAAHRGKDDEVVVVDGQPGPRFSSIVAGPCFCNESRHVAYIVSDAGGKFLVVDGERVGSALLPGADFVSDPAFAPDGRRVGFVAISGSFWAAWARNLAAGTDLGGTKAIGRSAKRRVYIDGQPGVEYDTQNITGLQFSPDSRHVVYVVHGLKDGSRRVSFVVTNRTEARRYDAVWTRTLSVQDAGSLVYVARAGRKFLRVTHAIQ